ncbi:MAG: hypothetical protein ACE5IZ_10285 [Dehalococcoidia bacterium]
MDFVRAWLELVLEVWSRRDFLAYYAGIVGIWFLWRAYRGLALRETRGLGWRRGIVEDQEAVVVGAVWLGLSAGLLATALYLRLA